MRLLREGEPRPGAAQVRADTGGVAPGRMDEGCGELDQPSEQLPVAGVVGAHPGGLELLVGQVEGAMRVGGQAPFDRDLALGGGQRSVYLGAAARVDDPARLWLRRAGR